MKRLIFILMLFAISTQAQVIKKIEAKYLTETGIVEYVLVKSIINDGMQDVYMVDLGDMEKDEDNKLVFVSKFENSYYIVKDAPFKLTQKELDELNGVVE